MIVCGWCGHPSKEMTHCSACGHNDPARPWLQRGEQPPSLSGDGRPGLDARSIRRRLAAAQRDLEEGGHAVTVEALAERLEVSPRTVRRWREMSA